MSDFKKCPKGHVYDSEKEKECPYCNNKTIDDDLEKIDPKEIDKPETAMCYDMGPFSRLDDGEEKW
ncbi:MAG: hypothetical protein FWB73_08635 [Treponema sp.]|nr:hypothetical protein [Treponema sp.]